MGAQGYSKSTQLIYKIANIYKFKEDYVKAIEYYNKVIELDPYYVEA